LKIGEILKKSIFLTVLIGSLFLCPSAFAWRYTPAALVTSIIPFPGGGFDVRPIDLTGIAGCTDLRVQKGVLGLTDADVHAYLALVLTSHATDKKLTFIINDADCYVYRVILN
jgi:hypothetical protein